MIKQLIQIQTDIHEHFSLTDPEVTWRETDIHYAPRFYFMPRGKYFDVVFYGDGVDYNEKAPDELFKKELTAYPIARVLDFLSQKEHAERILSMRFCGPDEGYNGTKPWNFRRLLSHDAVFPNLKSFSVELCDPGNHNFSIIENEAGSYEENGIIADLISRMPNIERLEIPSAPNQQFFEIGKLPIQEMAVQAGYDHQNFIENLASSENFPLLRMLDYSDYIHVILDYAGNETQYSSYKKLFDSKMFSEHEHFLFKLRYSILTQDQLSALMVTYKNGRKTKRSTQFLYIDVHLGRFVQPDIML